VIEAINDIDFGNIYDHIADDHSKTVFSLRLLYSLTGIKDYLGSIIRETDGGMQLTGELDRNSGRPLLIFGAGFWGRQIKKYYHRYNWISFVDNNKTGLMIENLKIISLDEAKGSYPDAFYVIAVRTGYEEIEKQLENNGIQKERFVSICPILDRMQEEQYFEKGIIELGKEEIFVDCGAYDGYTSANFIKRTQGSYKRIYAMEPLEQMAEKCITLFSKYSGVQVIQKACSDSDSEVSMSTNGPLSKVIESGSEGKYQGNVSTFKLDDLLVGGCSFIKMDIEGSEIKALNGAERAIKKYKPKLAVSVYHKPEDIYEIPQLILSMNPDYKLYLRHYTLCEYDTVLYCV